MLIQPQEARRHPESTRKLALRQEELGGWDLDERAVEAVAGEEIIV